MKLPLIDGIDGIATQLTPRESQIATLTARGLTNQQIADQLVLSVRTVETDRLPGDAEARRQPAAICRVAAAVR